MQLNYKRPENMERITTPALAEAFIAEIGTGDISET